MIISHKHKFIYVKTRKTAGTSIEIALSKICGPEDVITMISPEDEVKRKELGFRGPQNYKIPFSKCSPLDLLIALKRGKRTKFYNHMPCRDMVNYIDKEIWDSYYKFTIDRNPYDKVVSYFYFVEGQNNYNSIYDFIMDGGLKNMESYDLYSINKVLAVDKIYKYEDLDFFQTDLTEKLNLKEPFELTGYRAKSKQRKVRDYKDGLDERTKELIDVIFARELKLLGYQY